MQNFIREFMSHLRSRKYASASIEAWGDRLRRWTRFMEEEGLSRLHDVREEDLEKYRLSLVESGMVSSSVYIYLSYVKRFYDYLEEHQHIFINPARELVLPKCKRKLQPVPNEEEMKTLLAQPDISTPVGIRDRALLETAYSTGLRLEELIQLKVFDPDLKERTIRVRGKGRKERVVPLGRKAVRWLRRYVEEARPKLDKGDPDEESLWLGSQLGRRMNPVLVEQMVREYGRSAGIRLRITPHALRRACATHLLRGGAHPVEVQLLLGHSSLSTLSQYLKVTITDMKKMHEKSRPGR